ncbi:hypothetical protein GcM3_179017 [Golovinomyces cichoracearum]|uniref:Uncharacterized protein n=1 Tax=Golovinomyces cichoracearum TaxID=62708 RepID=A0A420HN94_9PEZI|nr:hypothetical protein GcM3_179017 [Golovinomyces cichoracearum]
MESATNSDDSFTDHLIRPTSSLRPVDKQIMKWKAPGARINISDEDENSESSKSTKYHKSTKVAGPRPEDATKTTNLSQAEDSSDRDSSFNRRGQRNNGGFLLPDFIPRSSSMTHYSSQKYQKTNSKKTHEKTYANTCSDIAAQVETLHPAKINSSIVQDTKKCRQKTTQPEQAESNTSEITKTRLCMDSAQIVTLALNLNESRKLASRFSMSNNPNLLDNVTNGNLPPQSRHRQLLSEHHSKPDKIERILTQSVKTPESGTDRSHPISINLNSNQGYTYHFSPSTLARSERAKTTFELMALYRRLLNFVSPLKQGPDKLENSKIASSILSDYSENFAPTVSHDSIRLTRHMGRSYNLLQYIRNRKLRARISKSIDGEAQGFGDIEKVSRWADDVAKVVSSSCFESPDKISLPKFPGKNLEKAIPDTSPEFCIDEGQKAPMKVRRPRNEWSINPADLIADLYWLEQDENKNIIEDRFGNLIFTKDFESRRLRTDEAQIFESCLENSSSHRSKEFHFDLRIDTDVPLFKSFKLGAEKRISKASIGSPPYNLNISDPALSLRGSDYIETHLASYQNRTRSRSQSLSSASGRGRRRHRRGAKSNSKSSKNFIDLERNDSYLIKEMLPFGSKLTKKSNDSLKPITDLSSENQHHRRYSTVQGTDTLKNGYQYKQRYDTRGIMPRNSGDYRESMSDSTTSSSPWRRSKRLKDSAITIIEPVLQQARNSIRRQSDELDQKEKRHRSASTTSMNQSTVSKNLRGDSLSSENAFSNLTSESEKRKKNSIDMRRRVKNEQVSGIRGFLRNARNPVSRVSNYFWRKDFATGNSSGFTLNDSDPEDFTLNQSITQELATYREKMEHSSQDDSTLVLSGKEEISFQQEKLQHFLSDKSTGSNLAELDVCSKGGTSQISPSQSLGQDHFHNEYNDVSPTFSLDQDHILHSDSGTSESSNQRPRSTAISEANARLNAILCQPGHPRKLSPPAGYANLEISDRRRNYSWLSHDRRTTIKDHAMNREIARVRTLLLSSGVKAKEFQRRADNLKKLTTEVDSPYIGMNILAQSPLGRVPTIQRHKLAVKILSEDMKCFSSMWNSSLDDFIQVTSKSLTKRITTLQTQLVEVLTPKTRTAANDADILSRDLVTDHRLALTHVTDQITQIMQRRRARFRWMRRGGWLIVEWVLIGIMWWVWFIVVIIRIFLGSGKLMIGGVKWLFWL